MKYLLTAKHARVAKIDDLFLAFFALFAVESIKHVQNELRCAFAG